MSVSGSTVVRRQLGRRLRLLRQQAGKTWEDVKEARLASVDKLWRIESGKTSVKPADVRELCLFYGADEQTTEALRAMALGTSEQGWWEDYGPVLPDWFGMYLGLEAGASTMYTYESELVHGLLQTAEYAEEVFRSAHPEVTDSAIQRYVALRLERQKVLTSRVPPLQIRAILSAAVLERQVGSASLMKAQIERLHEVAALDHVDVRVLPWTSGAHAAMSGAFTILDFDDPDDPPVAYAESYVGALYFERAGHVQEHRRVYKLIYNQSVSL